MHEQPSPAASHRAGLLASGIIVFAALVAYHNSFSGPFIFDDLPAIVDNPGIRHLWPALSLPHHEGGVIGRPVVNLSLAANYAAGGLQVRGYHAVNLAIHILAGLTLFGIVRRTLLRPAVAGLPPSLKLSRTGLRAGIPAPNRGPISHQSGFSDSATILAFTVAVIWLVHPLQTESVTCVIQRTESLMGLFYLLTLYFFIRGVDATGERSESGSLSNPAFSFQSPVFWFLASIASCLLGMATKEVMITAPLIVLLYDRTFVAGTFRGAWQQRRGWYLGLFGTWLVLGYLVVQMGGSRGEAAGFGLGLTPWTYALTQCRAIILYLWLAVWPHPLVLDYGTDVVRHAATVAPQALILLMLVGGTIFMLRQRPVLGFLGVWFFAILAPSSSIVPLVSQTMAEHRMYLPLAAVVTLSVLGLYALIGQRGVVACLALAVGLIVLTVRRNEDYRSALAIWSDTVAKYPGNARAQSNLANELLEAGRPEEALEQSKEALRLEPDYPEAHGNLATALLRLGRQQEAAAEYKTTLHLDPSNAKAHYNLANILAREGQLSEAIGHYEEAVRLKPADVAAHNNLAAALFLAGRVPEAIVRYEETLRLKPDFAEAHGSLGNALLRMGRVPDAMAQFEEVLRLKPGDEHARTILAQLRKAALEPPAFLKR